MKLSRSKQLDFALCGAPATAAPVEGLLWGLTESIPNTTLCNNMFGLIWVLFDLLAQLCYKYSQILCLRLEGNAPNFFQDKMVGEDLAFIVCKQA